MRRALQICLLLISAPAVAQPAERVEVTLANFKFVPNTIRLHHGQRYQLRLTNSAGGGHDFVAPEFFKAARVVSGPVSEGEIDIDGHASVTIDLIAPAAGRYPVHCSHFLHSTFGMNGAIAVD